MHRPQKTKTKKPLPPKRPRKVPPPAPAPALLPHLRAVLEILAREGGWRSAEDQATVRAAREAARAAAGL